MKYLEDSIKFFARHYILAIPLFILSAIPALISGVESSSLWANLTEFYSRFNNLSSLTQNPTEALMLFSGIFMYAVGAGIVALALKFIIIPGTYGLLNKALFTGKADLNDFVPSLKQNFIKYLLYWLGTLVIGIMAAIAAIIIAALLAAVISASKFLGIVLIIPVAFVFIIAAVALSVLLSLWFTAMVVENLELTDALKKSVMVAKDNFWILLGISVLVSLAGSIAGSVFIFINAVPFLGTLIRSAIPAIAEFTLIVFYMVLYREKSGLINSIEENTLRQD